MTSTTPTLRAVDPALFDDWHPVAASAALVPGAIVPVRLLGAEFALWRGADGRVRAWEDRCPHRGLRFSQGRASGDGVVCGYHGWGFDGDGRCACVPAHTHTMP